MVHDGGHPRSPEAGILTKKMKMKNRESEQEKKNRQNIDAGMKIVSSHNIFGRMDVINYVLSGRKLMGRNVPAKASHDAVFVNVDMNMKPEEWAYVIAHCILHMSFGHFDAEKMPGFDKADRKVHGLDIRLWNTACDIYVAKYLDVMHIGRPPGRISLEEFRTAKYRDEISIYNHLLENGVPESAKYLGTAGYGNMDMEDLDKPIVYDPKNWWSRRQRNVYAESFARALAWSITDVVSIAGGGTGHTKEAKIQ